MSSWGTSALRGISASRQLASWLSKSSKRGPGQEASARQKGLYNFCPCYHSRPSLNCNPYLARNVPDMVRIGIGIGIGSMCLTFIFFPVFGKLAFLFAAVITVLIIILRITFNLFLHCWFFLQSLPLQLFCCGRVLVGGHALVLVFASTLDLYLFFTNSCSWCPCPCS